MNSRRISVFSIILRILTLTLFSSSVCAWASIPADHPFINGYSSSISGEVLPYFSIYPKYAREALLTRCTDGKKIIEWYTDTVPPEMDADTIIFRWIAAHSSGTSSGERHFDLFVDDAYSLTFSTTPKSYPPMRSAFGQDGTSFSFEFIKRDGAEDAHGMAYLRVPRGIYVPGKPLRLKVVGHAQESNDWFMTFRYTFTEKVEVRVLPFLLRADSTTQPLRVVSLHFGEPDTLMVSFGDTIEASFYLQEGFNVFDLPVPIARQLQAISVQTTIGDYFSMDTVVLQQPVVPREIGLIHHAHTDIGYSHIQEDVIRIHTDNIRKALKLIDSTADAKDGSAFVWNIESSWAVEHFLAEAAPDERQRFFAAVKSGRIGVSATYLNVLTGLSVPEEFDWLTAYSRSL
ncbi:MAG: glycoside hydrolase, partial [Bacteroidota bacterium]